MSRGRGLRGHLSSVANRSEVDSRLTTLLTGNYYARAAVLAAAFACLASAANAAGLETASSARLLRSSVTPAFFSPLMNWP